jgi:hypothetical protein
VNLSQENSGFGLHGNSKCNRGSGDADGLHGGQLPGREVLGGSLRSSAQPSRFAFVSRSKRLIGVADAALQASSHLSVAAHRHRFIWSNRLTSSSCARMHSRITFSSRPTVDTQNPRAQQCCPTKLRFRSPYTRANCIALFPLIYPITCETANLGGIAIIICT